MKTIQTPRFNTRWFEDNDWRNVMEVALDWSKAPGPKFDKWPTAEDEVKGFTSHLVSSQKYWAVISLERKTVVGLLVVNGIQDGMADLGHVLHSEIQDGKQDLEILTAFVDVLFESEDIKGIFAYNDPAHREQIRPLLEMGFKAEDGNEGKLTVLREDYDKVAQ